MLLVAAVDAAATTTQRAAPHAVDVGDGSILVRKRPTRTDPTSGSRKATIRIARAVPARCSHRPPVSAVVVLISPPFTFLFWSSVVDERKEVSAGGQETESDLDATETDVRTQTTKTARSVNPRCGQRVFNDLVPGRRSAEQWRLQAQELVDDADDTA